MMHVIMKNEYRFNWKEYWKSEQHFLKRKHGILTFLTFVCV